MKLILPGSREFAETIDELPALNPLGGYQVIRPGNNGLPEIVTLEELKEYFYDGELDERMEEIDEYGDNQ